MHLLTASGAVWGVLALDAVAAGRPRAALGWLAPALVVDAIDGTLARRARVGEFLPQIDGALLDNLIDYLNYVVVPAALIGTAGFLPPRLAVAGAATICLVSAFQFAHREAKTASQFRGFPSYWNVVAAYLLLLDLPRAAAAALVALLAAAALTPLRFPYPSRAGGLFSWPVVAGALWLAALGVAVWLHPRAPRALVLGSLVYPVAYLAASARGHRIDG